MAETALEKVRVRPGDTVTVKLPWSGAVIHLGLPDQVRPVQLTTAGMAQILTPEGEPVSFPVTAGEAGLYYDADGYYTYPVATTQAQSPAGKRKAIIVLPTSYTPQGFVPSVIVEGEPGHSPLVGNGEHAQPWYWGHDFEKAQALADTANAELGLTPEDVLAIQVSTHRAQNKRNR